jgi:RNA polymerase-binding transcription factor DksA
MSLTSEQRHHLTERLREERDRAARQLHRIEGDRDDTTDGDSAGDISLAPTDMADRATDVVNEELDAADATRTSFELAEIDAALERLQAGPDAYGVCEATGQEIPFERLDVIPWARTIGPAGH